MDYKYFCACDNITCWRGPKELWSNLKFLKKAVKNTAINSKKQD